MSLTKTVLLFTYNVNINCTHAIVKNETQTISSRNIETLCQLWFARWHLLRTCLLQSCVNKKVSEFSYRKYRL